MQTCRIEFTEQTGQPAIILYQNVKERCMNSMIYIL